MKTIGVLLAMAIATPASADVVEQTEVTPAYGRAGMLELGASAGLMIAPDFRNVSIAPSIGWFVAENFEVTGILELSNIKADSDSTTVFASLVEPSYHLPLGRTTAAFAGMGIGYARISGLGGGLAVAPRIGTNFLLGRYGVLTPALSYEYTTHDTTTMPGELEDITQKAAASALRINVGYTAIW